MSADADADFDNYIEHIIYEYGAPITAAKHQAGILDALLSLSINPYLNAVRENASLARYGSNVRRENFKKMSIIYTIHDNIVYVHRILAGSMIGSI
jgi:hypothetical protein